jgi:hypothetical protein
MHRRSMSFEAIELAGRLLRCVTRRGSRGSALSRVIVCVTTILVRVIEFAGKI